MCGYVVAYVLKRGIARSGSRSSSLWATTCRSSAIARSDTPEVPADRPGCARCWGPSFWERTACTRASRPLKTAPQARPDLYDSWKPQVLVDPSFKQRTLVHRRHHTTYSPMLTPLTVMRRPVGNHSTRHAGSTPRMKPCSTMAVRPAHHGQRLTRLGLHRQERKACSQQQFDVLEAPASNWSPASWSQCHTDVAGRSTSSSSDSVRSFRAMPNS